MEELEKIIDHLIGEIGNLASASEMINPKSTFKTYDKCIEKIDQIKKLFKDKN